MIGLDVAAGAISIASLCITLVQGCIQTLSIIAEARQAGQTVERVALILDLEQFRLLNWAHRTGLLDDDTPSQKLNWDIVYRILSQLHQELSDTKVLREKNNLIPADGETIDDTESRKSSGNAKPAAGTHKSQLLSGRSWVHLEGKLRNCRNQILQGQGAKFKKLKWATSDHEKSRRLLSDISYFNNTLQELLDNSVQDGFRKGMEILLRDLLTRSTNVTEIKTLQAFLDEAAVANTPSLQVASRLKEVRLLLGVDRTSNEAPNTLSERPKLTRVKYENLTCLRSIPGYAKWQMAEYKPTLSTRSVRSHVLLEWKHSSKKTNDKVKKRIMELAVLMSTYSGANFHSLKCLGFLEQPTSEGSSKYAFVFEVLDLRGLDKAEPVPDVVSLSSMLDADDRPSLSRRVKMALTFAETILQMHTAGWLHKGICAANIVFVSKHQSGTSKENMVGPFVAGFDFARNSFEETETMPEDEKQILYQHSARRGSSKTTSTFRREYDLHALGCLLLEVVLWKNLSNIIEDLDPTTENIDHNPAKSESQAKHERHVKLLEQRSTLDQYETAVPVLEKVAFAGGDALRQVVELCLFPMTEWPKLKKSAAEDMEPDEIVEMSVDVQSYVVEILRSLSQHV